MKHMFSIASERQLALSALIDLEALPELDRMCRQYPDAPVIIDHLCRLGSGERYPINEENMNVLTAMAGHRNVHIKIGAFYALGKGTPPYLYLLPLIRRVVEAFSPERCLWETDCPFQLNKATYEDSLALIRDHADFLSPSDKHWILKGTAEKILFRI
jgi:predicted TIM-barrel fold metal-dependent hydrolase